LVSGETYANVQKILQGQQGGELTEKGMNQAKTLGIRLSKEQFTRIYCSDLNRTVQTASFITEHHPKTGTSEAVKSSEFVTDVRLREKHGGVLEGMPRDSFKKEAEVGFSANFFPESEETHQAVQGA